MLDNVELIDSSAKGYETGRIHSNLIRLKPGSFDSVKNKWKNFRISLLSKKLDKVKDELNSVVEQSNLVDNELEDTILAKTAVIARLEEKIKVLSKENVPSNFVKTRAIKLKDEMIANVSKNSASAYAVEKTEEKEVEDNLNDYGFTDFANTDFAMAAAVDTNANKAEEERISNEDIRSIIDDRFSALNGTKEEKTEEVEDNNVSTDSEDLSGLFKETVQENIEDSPANTVDRDEIEKEVIVDETEPENFKVSQNETTPAKIEQFSDVKEKKSAADVYKDMSEEELSKSRDKIEYNKYEESYSRLNKLKSNIINSASNLKISVAEPNKSIEEDVISSDNSKVRDEIIVTPDRDEVVAEKVENKEENLRSDWKDTTIKEGKASEISMSKEDVEMLKTKLQEELEQGKNSREELDNAERELINATKEHEDVSEEERITSEKVSKELSKNEMLKQKLLEARSILVARLEAEAEDIRRNNEKRNNIEEERASIEKETATKRANVEQNERRYQETTENNADLESMINEIYSAIGERAVNVRVVEENETHIK